METDRSEQERIKRVSIRRNALQVIASASPHAVSEPALMQFVSSLMPGSVLEIDELRLAREWLLAKDFIRSRWNDDLDQKEWLTTDRGQAQAER